MIWTRCLKAETSTVAAFSQVTKNTRLVWPEFSYKLSRECGDSRNRIFCHCVAIFLLMNVDRHWRQGSSLPPHPLPIQLMSDSLWGAPLCIAHHWQNYVRWNLEAHVRFVFQKRKDCLNVISKDLWDILLCLWGRKSEVTFSKTRRQSKSLHFHIYPSLSLLRSYGAEKIYYPPTPNAYNNNRAKSRLYLHVLDVFRDVLEDYRRLERALGHVKPVKRSKDFMYIM